MAEMIDVTAYRLTNQAQAGMRSFCRENVELLGQLSGAEQDGEADAARVACITPNGSLEIVMKIPVRLSLTAVYIIPAGEWERA